MKNFILSDGTSKYQIDLLQIKSLFERLEEGQYKIIIEGTESESFDISVGGTSASLDMAGDSIITYDKTDGQLNVQHGDGSLYTIKTLNPHGSLYPILYETEPDSYLTGYSSYSIRNVIQNPSALFAHSSTNSLRLRLQSLSSYPTTITDVYIGYKASSGNAWDFESVPVNVTFGDQSSIIIDSSGVISDLIDFQLDETKDFVIAYNMEATGTYVSYASETDCTVYAKASVQEAHLQNPTGYSSILTDSIIFMGAIGGEVPDEYWNGANLPSSRFTITGNVIIDETANGIIIPTSRSISQIDVVGGESIIIDKDETITFEGLNGTIVTSESDGKKINIEHFDTNKLTWIVNGIPDVGEQFDLPRIIRDYEYIKLLEFNAFVPNTGTTGSNISVDFLQNEVSVYTDGGTKPTISSNTGLNQFQESQDIPIPYAKRNDIFVPVCESFPDDGQHLVCELIYQRRNKYDMLLSGDGLGILAEEPYTTAEIQSLFYIDDWEVELVVHKGTFRGLGTLDSFFKIENDSYAMSRLQLGINTSNELYVDSGDFSIAGGTTTTYTSTQTVTSGDLEGLLTVVYGFNSTSNEFTFGINGNIDTISGVNFDILDYTSTGHENERFKLGDGFNGGIKSFKFYDLTSTKTLVYHLENETENYSATIFPEITTSGLNPVSITDGEWVYYTE